MALSGARYKLISRICNPANMMHSQAAEGQLFFDEVHAAAAATMSPATTTKLRTAVVLHGLLGSGRNLRSLAQDLCRQAAAATGQPWRALLVDLRCHGRSASAAGLPPPNDLESTALDVVRLLQRQLEGSAPEALIGHSLGGKTALEVVRQLALPGQTPQPKAVWVLDARPTAMLGNPDGATRDVQHVLESVRGIQVPLASREELYRLLGEQGFSRSEWLVSQHGLIPCLSLCPALSVKRPKLLGATTRLPAHTATHRMWRYARFARRSAAVAGQQSGSRWRWPPDLAVQRGRSSCHVCRVSLPSDKANRGPLQPGPSAHRIAESTNKCQLLHSAEICGARGVPHGAVCFLIPPALFPELCALPPPVQLPRARLLCAD